MIGNELQYRCSYPNAQKYIHMVPLKVVENCGKICRLIVYPSEK